MQTTYTANPARGFPGQPADNGYKDDVSGIAEEVIPPGLVVFRGTDPDRQVRLPQASDTDTTGLLGVSVRSHAMSDDDGYADEQAVPVRRIGRICVVCEDAFTPSSSVYVRTQTGSGGTQPGSIRTDADTATAIAWSEAKFTNSGSAGEIAVLQVLHN